MVAAAAGAPARARDPGSDAEKFAATSQAGRVVAGWAKSPPEKNFLMHGDQSVKSEVESDGIGGAKSGPNMPSAYTISRAAAGTQAVVEPVVPMGEPQASPAVGQAPALPVTPTLAPVLAQRAVETVLNVVDAQEAKAGQGGIVKLDFNFGGEALAVHVQMRGGEVHTEFRTNSAELRTALSAEWRAAATQRDPEGVRLVEPVFASGESGSSTSNASDGFSPQNHSSQHQQPQGAGVPASLRPFRSAGPSLLGDPADLPSQSPVMLPTSLHLAAVA